MRWSSVLPEVLLKSNLEDLSNSIHHEHSAEVPCPLAARGVHPDIGLQGVPAPVQ